MDYKTSTISGVCSVVTDGSHFSPKSVDEGCYMVSVKDFTEYGFDFSGCRKISELDYEALKKAGCVPEYGDILVGKDGARYFEDIIIYRQPEKPALLSSIAIKLLPQGCSQITRQRINFINSPPITNKIVSCFRSQ